MGAYVSPSPAFTSTRSLTAHPWVSFIVTAPLIHAPARITGGDGIELSAGTHSHPILCPVSLLLIHALPSNYPITSWRSSHHITEKSMIKLVPLYSPILICTA
ncbi:hypothetical protein BV22DRAFT_1031945 [Leucogyrophana mollusca]|uniref:Uncharacterized protein n=1 Tax=Leucogyrophana mollusca TaxID=85980 RepID=A0ACB8BQ36_9AGAM|nr:hypothetical protein BV22DRAFT_1031945 [Leucogyrophana mollusca]